MNYDTDHPLFIDYICAHGALAHGQVELLEVANALMRQA
jgi:hypothetical protein